MRDALTPYLKARIHDFQLFSLRTLVRIIIGETFGSNENSHNSENAAHDWQIVVKKVTGLISKEVTDLSGTEWKDEDGTYNTSVINLLRLIKIVNSELGRHNAPLVYTLQSPKDIARTMIDANIVRNICGVLTDLHQQTLVITDNERNKMLSSYVRNILWNYTDSDADFVEHVASVPGFLEFLIDKLASESKYHLHLHEEVIRDQSTLRISNNAYFVFLTL